MNKSTVWIDHHKAIILDYKNNGIQQRELIAHGQKSQEHLRKFYHEVADSLKSTNCMLLAGPGMAKEEFRNHCEDHHPKLAKAIVEVKNMKDHPSDEEIEKFSHDFFNRYSNWVALES